jgi:hypothetical protein
LGANQVLPLNAHLAAAHWGVSVPTQRAEAQRLMALPQLRAR